MLTTVEIRGCNSTERFKQVEECVSRPLRMNAPNLYLDCQSREEADFAKLHLNLLAGIKAEIVGDDITGAQKLRHERQENP